MNDPNQGQNQGQPQAAPVQPPPVLPGPQAPPQAQPAPPVLPPVLPPPPPPASPVAIPFALAPGRNDHVLDWTNPAHTKQYYKATSPLDSTEKFDGQANKIRLFLAHIEDRAQQFNWQSILTIPVGLPPTSYNLIRDYGRMSLQDVQAKALTYVRIQGREAQDSYMLYNFLIESLTDSFKAQVLLYEQDYTITPIGGQPAMKDGPTLLKRLIMLTYIDNRATTAHIRETLIDMATQLIHLQGDITSFNDWVREQVRQLAARGTGAPDLLTYLWKTYLQAPAAEFKRYIKTLKAEYKDERQDYSAEQLMLLAENKYKNLKQAGEWGNLSDAEAEIVALNAKIEVLKQKGTKKPEVKAKKEEKKDENKKKTEIKKPDFRWQKPWANQTKRTVEGKEYYWCPNHQNKTTKEWGQCVRHQPEDCKNKQQKQTKKTAEGDTDTKPTTSLQPNAILAAFDTIDSDTE